MTAREIQEVKTHFREVFGVDIYQNVAPGESLPRKKNKETK